MTNVVVLNGPNLGRLGTRQPDVYGTTTYESLVQSLHSWGEERGISVEVRQTDDEETLAMWLTEAARARVHVILNAAAFTHYSRAVAEACAKVHASGVVLVEVHISNPHAREKFRHTSVVSGVATGVISGFGTDSYRLALEAVAARTPQ